VLKEEICYSLAWAVSQAMSGFWVITESIQALAAQYNFNIPRPCKVLNGRNAISFLPERQADVAKLVISSVLRKEMADEISVSEDWIYQVVSKVYDQFGIKDFLKDEQALREYVGDDEIIVSYFQRVYQDSRSGKHPKDLETMAFHIITMPEMVELK
jgi:DNA-binding NarL/FixJ family response regulator